MARELTVIYFLAGVAGWERGVPATTGFYVTSPGVRQDRIICGPFATHDAAENEMRRIVKAWWR